MRLQIHVELDEYVRDRKTLKGGEGHTAQQKANTKRLQKLIQQLGTSKKVLEIGFNCGHSACTMLDIDKNVTVTSFDLGLHYDAKDPRGGDYGQHGHAFVNDHFPGRLELILGDSKETVPEYIKNNPEEKFDLIFIDGDHHYAGAKADIENCMGAAHGNTIVVLDDHVGPPWEFSSLVEQSHIAAMKTGGGCPGGKYIPPGEEWILGFNKGPNKAWAEAIAEGKVQQISTEIYAMGRGTAWGKYIIK